MFLELLGNLFFFLRFNYLIKKMDSLTINREDNASGTFSTKNRTNQFTSESAIKKRKELCYEGSKPPNFISEQT